MIDNKRYEQMVNLTKERFVEGIKDGEKTLGLSTTFVSHISGRSLPGSALYQLDQLQGEGRTLFIEHSQHGFLTLIDIEALIEGRIPDMYLQECGTYDRDGNHLIKSIYLDSRLSPFDKVSRAFFSDEVFKELVKERYLYLLGQGGGGGGSVLVSSQWPYRAHFRIPQPVIAKK